jgi:hypothetical protein
MAGLTGLALARAISTSEPQQLMPGCPAMGHVTPKGFWHPGKTGGCPKCR